jgi:hypothetical protein
MLLAALVLSIAACGRPSSRGRSGGTRDAGMERTDSGEGIDAGREDAGTDAGREDAGRDAGFDAGTDTGPSCTAPEEDCDGTCTNTSLDPDNCGRCGITCAGGWRCVAGFCMEPGTEADGDLRIVDGASGVNGRLEIFHNGMWGTICDDSFTDTNATVACRQLGYTSGIQHQSFGGGVDPIWMDNVSCTGTESRLADCTYLGSGTPDWSSSTGPTPHNCSHGEDIGVTCAP